MEVAALNERLREAFSPVLRHLARLERARADAATAAAAAAATRDGGDAPQYRAHCLTVLRRLNTYQYGTRAAFARDLQQLEQLAPSADAARLLQDVAASVKDRERAEAGEAPASKRARHSAAGAPGVMIHGLRFTYSGVPAIQPVAVAGQARADAPRWRSNVSVQGVALTTGERESPAAALALYEAQRRELAQSARGLASLMELSGRRLATQRHADERALRDALATCIPRLAASTSVRVPDLVAPPKVGGGGGGGSGGPAVDDRPPEVSSPTSSVASSASTGAAAAAAAASRASTWRNPKRKKPADRLTFLRLRRLIQLKLCHHLRGQPVCVLARPESADKADADAWTATGRLEGGRVVVLATRKTLSFSEYVAGELGRQVSACAHMFLVRSRESIDDHLKVCDAFSEEDREQLGHDLYGSVRNYMQQAKGKRR